MNLKTLWSDVWNHRLSVCLWSRVTFATSFKIHLIALLMMGQMLALAQPANDHCANATVLTVNADLNCGVIANGTTTGATPSNVPTCGGNADDDVWYQFVATSPRHRIKLSNATAWTFVEVLSGSCNALTSKKCTYFYTPGGEYQLYDLTVGQTYWIRVYTYDNLVYTNFKICVGTPPLPPVNDECSNAIELTVNADLNCNVATTGSTMGGTPSLESCGGNADDDVWYKFVATSPRHRIKLFNTTVWTFMETFSGSCSAPNSKKCTYFYNPGGEYQLYDLVVGQTYWIRVYTYDNLVFTPFKICIGTPPLPPGNDECENAMLLPVNADLNCTVTTVGTTSGGTPSLESCGGNADDDVWYKFVATSPRHRIKLSNTSVWTFMEAFSGSCNAPVSQKCRYFYNPGGQYQLYDLVVGQTYWIRVYTYDNLVYTNFNICIGTPPPLPVNDECENAISLTVHPDLNCATPTQGTTAGGTPSLESCGGNSDDDVWYKFVAAATSHKVRLTGTAAWTFVQTFSGSCNAPFSEKCSYFYENGGEYQLNDLQIGSTYWIRVYTYDDLVYTNFSICIGTQPPPPSNDDCVASIALPLNLNEECTATLQGSTVSATNSQAGCTGNADDDVWYYFNATSTRHILKVTDASADIVVQVFSGACGALQSVVCRDASSIGAETVELSGLTVGQNYYCRVYTYYGAIWTNFKICLTTPIVASNDDCANATLLTANVGNSCANSVQGSTANATQSQVGCAGMADDDVWYKFVATATRHKIAATAATNDLVIEVFSGACGSLTQLTCQDAASEVEETAVVNNLVIGQTYYFRVYTYAAAHIANFNLCINAPVPPPANDECVNATPLTVNADLNCGSTTTGSTAYATESFATECLGASDDDIWYQFVATATNHRLKLSNVTAKVVVQMYNGHCEGFTTLLCESFEEGEHLQMLSGLTVGMTYWLRVYSYDESVATNFKLCIGTFPRPANDNCTGAIAVAVNNGCTNLLQGTTAGATLSQASCAGTADDDVWYQFVATGTAHKITIGNPSEDVVLQVFKGTCAQLQSLACKNDSETTEILELSGLVVGQTYFIRVYSYHPADIATFTVCVQNACAIPTNVAASNITATGAKLSWGVAANGKGYTCWYRVVGSGIWNPLTSTAPTVTLSTLTPNTDYEAQVVTQCNPAGSSDPSSLVRFKTLPPVCTRITVAPTVANLTSTTATINWAVATLTNTYLVQYKRSTETVWTERTVSTNTIGLIGLVPSTSYTVRIVKNCTNGGISDPSPEKSFTTTAPCEPPATTVPILNYANATVRWNALTGVSGYEVRYKAQTAANWVTPTKTATAAATSVLLTGLVPNTTYEYQIRLKCSATNFSAYSESRTFTTPTCVAVVPSVRNVTQTSIMVQWTPIVNVAGYEVHFRKVGVQAWTIRPIATAAISNFNITGLVKATNYEIRMVTKCVAANGNSDFSTTIQAMTAGAVSRPESSEASAETGLKIQVSPNPTIGTVFLYVTSPERGMGRWMLRDYLGRMVMHQDGLETEAGEQMYSIDLTHLNAGMYVLQWVQGDILRTQTILVQRY